MIAFFLSISKTGFFIWPALVLDMDSGFAVQIVRGPVGLGIQFGGKVG